MPTQETKTTVPEPGGVSLWTHRLDKIEKKKMERVIGTDELKSGERRSVFVDDMPALVIRIESDYFVIEDVCSHDGQPLTEGPIQGCSIVCPQNRFECFAQKSATALSGQNCRKIFN